MKIARALISVSDKAGIVEFASGLAEFGVEIVSTGGTAKALREAGLEVADISEVTGFPEILDGRVKTLHPMVHGGLLFRRDLPAHVTQAAAHKIQPIDLVVVNLYPFEKTIAREGVALEEAIEQIDIGGPSMLRSAAKNWESVTVVVDHNDYAAVLAEMRAHAGNTQRQTRLTLAVKVFAQTSRYDGAICAYLENAGENGPAGSIASSGTEKDPAPTFSLNGVLSRALRYGENPHQKGAALYVVPKYSEPCVAAGQQISGKDMGFNNLLDLNAAFEIVREFAQPAVSIVKHNNPCGAAIAEDLLQAYELAYAGDPLSAFGGVLGLNRELDARIAEAILSAKGFKVDAIVAPSITPEAVELLTKKKKWGANVILIETGNTVKKAGRSNHLDVRTIPGGILIQPPDALRQEVEFSNLKTVTKREPTLAEHAALRFAWILCKHVKSNAIVLAKAASDAALPVSIVGVGAGQMSRVDSVEMSIKKAGERAKGSVLASDAFFPFSDGPEAAAQAGVTAIIQPGGSVKDDEVIAACDKHGIAMVTTGIRHFRH